MRISIAWLRDYVNLGDRSPEKIASDLTLRTALIEGVETKGHLPELVVVGRVVDCVVIVDSDFVSVPEAPVVVLPS